jgi:electron transport complex protein RnfC
MMGFAIEELHAPVIKATNCLLVPSKTEMPDPAPQQACIRCGMCAEACPAALLPQQLYWYSRSEDFEKLEAHNLADCIECGACSYVCPSNIPLVQYYRASKGAIRIHNQEKEKSEHARKRFEFRKARVEQQEAEKEAKRAARKKAAEEAQKLAAEKKTADSQEAKTTTATPSNDDPDKERAKLERALSSAKSRLERAGSNLQKAKDEGAEQTRLDTLTARLKEAELKVEKARTKLDEFNDANAQVKPQTSTLSETQSESANVKLRKSIDTLEKRLATAQTKVQEAEQANSDTLSALKSGLEKLQQKLEQAKAELAESSENTGAPDKKEESNAADAAIEKAKKRAAEQQNMSDDEKRQTQISSLRNRLDKAQKRLTEAEEKDDEHIDVYRESVRKLELKLQGLELQ